MSSRTPEHPDIDDAVCDGKRFRVVGTIAGQPYESAFGLDAGVGDPMHGRPDVLTGEDYLAFIGMSPVALPCTR